MKIYIGADIGGSAVKLIAADENMNIFGKSTYPSDNDPMRLVTETKAMLDRSVLRESDIAGVSVTGVGAYLAGGELLGAPVKRFGEFMCFGRGAQYISGHSKMLAVSMGTGTAFVLADGKKYTHLGGSGVGGGTLTGLSGLITGETESAEINRMISCGNAANVDLTVGDICPDGSSGLGEDVTAANFGKKTVSRNKNDIAAGIANMIFQTAGVMAALACRGTDISHAVFVGAMTEIPAGRNILRAVGTLHGMEFDIPEQGAYAGSLGAVLLFMGK